MNPYGITPRPAPDTAAIEALWRQGQAARAQYHAENAPIANPLTCADCGGQFKRLSGRGLHAACYQRNLRAGTLENYGRKQ